MSELAYRSVSNARLERPVLGTLSRMRYDLGVWISPHPRDDADAGEVFVRLVELMNRDDSSVPTAPLSAFARDLLTRWPELAVWATAEGIRVTALNESDRLEQIVAAVAMLARRHGMICYDPQRQVRIA
jgi:hypothetical protein